jgi:hypothetical protein
MRKFTPDFAEIIKPLQKMIHKDTSSNGVRKERNSFNEIKVVFLKPLFYEAPISTNIFSFILFPLISP